MQLYKINSLTLLLHTFFIGNIYIYVKCLLIEHRIVINHGQQGEL